MANRNFANSRIYSGSVMPVEIDLNFIVNAADTGGLGITNLKGAYVTAVYMHTSATPSTGNPNPAIGNIVVQLNDNYANILDLTATCESPKSGSDIKVDNTAMTVGAAYVITTLGNSTTAQWITLGVPAGVTPAVGVAFIALLTGIAGQGNTSTSKVQIAASTGSAVANIEILGNPDTMVAPALNTAQTYGASLILQCRDYAGALVNPVDLSKVFIKIKLSNSSVTIGGQ